MNVQSAIRSRRVLLMLATVVLAIGLVAVPQVRWRVLEHWTLTGGFDVRNQDLEDTGRATSHSVFLALNYETAPIPVFR